MNGHGVPYGMENFAGHLICPGEKEARISEKELADLFAQKEKKNLF